MKNRLLIATTILGLACLLISVWSPYRVAFAFKPNFLSIGLLKAEASDGWLSSYYYRKGHVISAAPGAGTNYQVKINCSYGSALSSSVSNGVNFASDFEGPGWDSQATSGTTVTVSTDWSSRGGHSLKISNIDAVTDAGYFTHLITTNPGEFWASTDIYLPTIPAFGSGQWLNCVSPDVYGQVGALYDVYTAKFGIMYMTSSGLHPIWEDGNYTILPATKYTIQIHVKISPSAGILQLWANDTEVMNKTGLNTSYITVNNIFVGQGYNDFTVSTPFTEYFDNFCYSETGKIAYGATNIGDTVYLENHARADFGDVRFTANDGITPLDYWLQEEADGKYATFWVKIPNDLSSSNASVYVYYGNSSVATASNGANTFIFFDHFDNGSIGSGWSGQGTGTSTESGTTLTLTANSGLAKNIYSTTTFGINTRALIKDKCTVIDVGTGFCDASYNNFNVAWIYGNCYLKTRISSGTTTKDIGLPIDTDYHLYYVMRNSSTQDSCSIDLFNSANTTVNVPTGNLPVLFYGYNGGTLTVDWVAVTKYVSPEPANGEWGSEESGSSSTPAAPSGLTATTISTTQISLSWQDNASDETGLKVERKTGAPGTYAQIATTGSGVSVYNDSGLTAGTTYYYRVMAYNGNGNSAYSNEASATTQTTSPPAAPPPPTAVADGAGLNYNGEFWLFGGYSGDHANLNTRNTVQIFNGTSWRYGPVIPTPRWCACAAELNGIAYVFGGATNSYGELSTAEALNISTGTWSTKTSFPFAFRAGEAVSVPSMNRIFIFIDENVYSFDPTGNSGMGSYTRMTDAPISRRWTTCGLVNIGGELRIYHIGGIDATDDLPLGGDRTDNYYYRPVQDDWIGPLAPAPYAADGQTGREGVVFNGTSLVYGFGEFVEQRFYGYLYTYDASIDKFSSLLATGTPRDGVNSTVINGVVYVIGGRNTEPCTGVLSLNEAFNLSSTPTPTPPAAPSGLTATTISTTQINLSWQDNASDETGLKVERKTGASGTYAQIATTGSGVSFYNDSGLTAGTTYYYRVMAYNGNGNSAYSNEASSTTPTQSPPVAPSGLSATVISTTQINLSWQDNASDESGFKVERKTGASGTYAQIGATGSGVSVYNDSGLAAGTTYYYRVMAYNGNGNSAYSNEASAITRSNTNLAMNKTATADSQQTSYGNIASKGNDGNFFTRWSANNNSLNHWWKVDLGDTYTLSSTKVVFQYARNYRYKIEISTDNVAWTLVVNQMSNTSSSQTRQDTFSTVQARYVRITYTGLPPSTWSSHYEFAVYGY